MHPVILTYFAALALSLVGLGLVVESLVTASRRRGTGLLRWRFWAPASDFLPGERLRNRLGFGLAVVGLVTALVVLFAVLAD